MRTLAKVPMIFAAFCMSALGQSTITVDVSKSCGQHMAGAVPFSISQDEIRTLDQEAGAGTQLHPEWDTLVKFASEFVERGFGLDADVRIASRMPFEDRADKPAMNPACFITPGNLLLLSDDFLGFAFPTDRPKNAAVAFAVLFHEYGHAFAARDFPDEAVYSGRTDIFLYQINNRANELFADMFAGLAFYYWTFEVQQRFNLDDAQLGKFLRGAIDYDNFRSTFHYMGCMAPPYSKHGTHKQRLDAFMAGAFYADKLDFNRLSEMTEEELNRFVIEAVNYLAEIDDAAVDQTRC